MYYIADDGHTVYIQCHPRLMWQRRELNHVNGTGMNVMMIDWGAPTSDIKTIPEHEYMESLAIKYTIEIGVSNNMLWLLT